METTPPKRRFQFKLRTLLLVIAAVSLALAAMKFASTAWATAIGSITIFGLLFSIVLAVFRRPFCVGFAVCCGGYLLVFSIPILSGGGLFTTLVTDYLFRTIHPRSDYLPRQDPPRTLPRILPPGKIGTDDDYNRVSANFYLIAHYLWAIIVGAAGGMIAQFAAGRPRAQTGAEPSRAIHSENGR